MHNIELSPFLSMVGWLVSCVLQHINPCKIFNAVYTYVLKYMICKQIVYWEQFLNKPEVICLHIVKWFQVLLSNTVSFICTQLNGF